MREIVDRGGEQREALSSFLEPEVNRAQCCLPGTEERLKNKNVKNMSVSVSAVREKNLISLRNY